LSKKNRADLNRIIEDVDNKIFNEIFYLARTKKRKFIAYLGPTNSGKTYAALEALKNAEKGTYLAPLRLMALENYEKLRDANLNAGLKTGEEEKDLDGCSHICQTIETANFSESYNVAVIDEIQLLTDINRGGFWLNAVIGISADIIYLCGARFIETVLRELISLTGDELEINYTERKSPLIFSEKEDSVLRLPEKGTAFIAFSRKNVLAWKELLEDSGASVSVIYGSLSPEVRREQSRRFREGESNYLVATDAIGMGLNLPIKKIIFTDTSKFDGENFRPLGVQEVKQIAGRAGRYGIVNCEGIVSSYSSKELDFLKTNYFTNDPVVSIKDIHIRPNQLYILNICDSLNNYSLKTGLSFFNKGQHSSFSINISEDELSIADDLDHIFSTNKHSFNDKWLFFISPIDIKNKLCYLYFKDLLYRYKKTSEIGYVELGIQEYNNISLEQAEAYRKNITLYLWLSLKKPDVFCDYDKAKYLSSFYDDIINNYLSKYKKNKSMYRVLLCKKCKATMQPFSQFELCFNCHKSHGN